MKTLIFILSLVLLTSCARELRTDNYETFEATVVEITNKRVILDNSYILYDRKQNLTVGDKYEFTVMKQFAKDNTVLRKILLQATPVDKVNIIEIYTQYDIYYIYGLEVSTERGGYYKFNNHEDLKEFISDKTRDDID